MSADEDKNVTELQQIPAEGSGQETLEPTAKGDSPDKAMLGHMMGNWAGKVENDHTQKLKLSLRRKYTIGQQRREQLEKEAARYQRDKVLQEKLKSGISDDGKQMTLIERMALESQLSSGTLQRQSFKKAMASPFQQFWMSDFEQNREKPSDRQVWNGRWSFVMAAIGSAVGLGNFWRFPYLTYKHGGAQFFIPYLLSLIFIGMPLMIMEFGLGQITGKGTGGAFRIIQKRLPGIGFASAFASFVILVYYNVIIGHGLIYFVYSFMSPMPWAGWKQDFPQRCKNADQSRAEEIYNIDILQYYDQSCNELDTSSPTTFSMPSFFASLAIWIICFFCVARGIRNIQYIVWASVPLPFLFMLILIIRFATLPGAGNGISKYMSGEGVNTVTEANKQYVPIGLQDRTVWVDACGQVFFSLGVSMGIMTAYASHFKTVKKPIVGDAVTVSVVDSLASFLAGFVVWAAIGFLEAKKDLTENETENVALIFVTMPNAIDKMDASNAWMLLFTSMFFFLGLDSSFSFLEGVTTTINDLDTFIGTPRALITFIVCIMGIIFSIPFCFNWGFVLLDTVDHYLNTYLLVFIGIIQCYGCGWAFDLYRTMKKPGKEGQNYYAATLISVIGYWLPLTTICTVCIAIRVSGWGALAFILIQLLVVFPASYCVSGLSFTRWYREIVFCGVRRLGYAMTKRGRENPQEVAWWEPAFVFYWGFCVQYMTPALLWFIIIGSLVDDVEVPFEENTRFQVIGIMIPVIGFLLFFLATFLCVDEEITDPTLLDDEATRMQSESDEDFDAEEDINDVGVHNLDMDRVNKEAQGEFDNMGRMPRGHRSKAAKDMWKKLGGLNASLINKAAAAGDEFASGDKAEEFAEGINN